MNITPIQLNKINKTNPDIGLRVSFRAQDNNNTIQADTFQKQQNGNTQQAPAQVSTVNKVITSFKKLLGVSQPINNAQVQYLSDDEIKNMMYNRGYML